MSGTWSEIQIAGKEAHVFEPSQPRAGRAVIHLHGHGCETLLHKPVYTAELERLGLRTICPCGKRSWWLPQICNEFDAQITPYDFVRESIVEWIGNHWQIAPPSIALTGISMGGQGALQLSYRDARRFPIVAAIAPAIDFQNWIGSGVPLDEMFESKESARQQTVTLHLHPLNWPRHQLLVCDPQDADWIESSERLASKLYSTGIPFASDFETSHGGHSWDYFDKMAPRVMQFVADAFDKESLV